jgi:ADP-dependent NAD(P)H-hydrate dehydratase / NAD(P)H-hydrate epimerase
VKIFTNDQIRTLDQFTIENEPILSIDLMERAAESIKRWVEKNLKPEYNYYIFCGTGNNGGDGLALARLLFKDGFNVNTFIMKIKGDLSLDCATNEKNLWEAGAEITYLHTKEDFSKINLKMPSVIIEALFGTGLNRAITGLGKDLIEFLNNTSVPIISIDLPSGMSGDGPNFDNTIIESDFVLSFQAPKLSFLLPENENYIENWTILDIGLSPQKVEELPVEYHFLMQTEVAQLISFPSKFSHKGNNGHGLLIAGSKGMTGASILSAKAALKAGIGKLTVATVERNYTALQTAVPEAMCLVQGEMYVNRLPEIENFDFQALGPGVGMTKETEKLVYDLIKKATNPLVLDADALNILAQNKAWIPKIPKHSILTPHLGEFERLVGESKDSFQRIKKLKQFATENDLIVILKGAHTAIALPNGMVYFNSSGNPGMATAGCGDVLTGVLLALLCQGYNVIEASLIGVYIHGKAGDLALENESFESLIASDVILNLGKAFNLVKGIEGNIA